MSKIDKRTMILKQLIVIIPFLCLSYQAQSQEVENIAPQKQKEESRFIDKVVFGGDFGLSFGSSTYIKIAPIVGYKITPRFTAGVGPIYIYERYKYNNYIGGTLETSTYGGKVFASFVVLKSTDEGGVFPIGNLLLYAENEVLSVEPFEWDLINGYHFGERIAIDNLLMGFGLNQPIGRRFGVSLFVLWDVTGNPNSIYSNPIIRFGFNF